MHRNLFWNRWPHLVPAGIFACLLVGVKAADTASEVWPDRPVPDPPQVMGPGAPGDALALPPQAPDDVLVGPLSPTQAVPPGVRELKGLAVSYAPKDSPFEVDAPDFASANRVMEICDRMKVLADKFFTWPDKPGRIQIQLIPAARANFAGPFVIQPSSSGRPMVLVRWSAETTFFDMNQAVCGVTLQNINYAKDGEIAGQVPDWLKLGLAAWLEVGFKPALMDQLVDETRRVPLTMRQIMTARAPTGPDVLILKVNAFWLVMFLNDQCANANVAHALFNALAVGIDPAPLLGTAFPGKFDDPRALELWWQIGLRDELAAHAAPFQSITETRTLLDDLERIQLVRANIPQRVRLDEAWESHADKDVVATLEKTLLSVRYVPNRASPVYKNALVSLMIALQQFHDGDKKAFDFAWKQYLADRSNSEATEDLVNAAMTDGASK